MYNRPHFTSPNSSRKGQQHPQALPMPTPTPTPPQPQFFYFNQSHNPYFPNPNPSFPNHHLPTPHFQNQQYPNYPTPPPPPQQTLEAIDRAVTNAHRELLAARQTISAWKVSQIALKALQTDSWNSLCFKMQQVPSLYQIMLLEGKVNAFIHCFVEVRKITSLYDLKVELCKNEGVKKFKDLQLGPLLKHPLVLHYFLVPSDVKKVYKITSQEIVSYLAEYMDLSKKKVQVEGFLDFIATKQSVSAREQLCIRIQNLRMHIASIKEARKAEDTTLNNCLRILDESSKRTTKKFESKSSHRRPLFPQKKVLDRRFDAISQRVKSFTPIHEVGSNHIRFVSSSSEDESDDNDVDTQADKKDSKVGSSQCKLSSKSSKNSDRVSSCPYPSAIEEMERLGLKSETGGQSTPSSSGFRCDENKISTAKKRKSGDQSVNIPKKLPKPDMDTENELSLQESDKRKTKEQSTKNQSAHVGENGLNHLTGDDMEKFITTWKEACRVHSVTEVFDRMLQFYGTTDRKRKKLRSIFSSFPCIGILDVAVTSIKYGMWDSVYDKLQTIGDHGCVGSVSDHNEPEMIDVEPSSGRDSLSFKDQSHKLECSVSFDDIVKKVASYFEHNNAIPREGKSPFQKQMIFLRMLRDCEEWLTEQFSIEEFGSLGYVDFFQFIEEHPSALPNEFIRSLSDDLSKKSNFAVSMLQHQLIMMLTQAASSLWEKEIITKQHINILLQKQFPLVSFQVSENGFLEDGLEFLKKHKKSDISSSVLYSVTLLRTYYDRHSLAVDDYSSLETPGAVTDFGRTSGALGTVSNKDAMQCLLKAPMLTDLLSWSHWDLIFAPSLGPLVEWLLSEAHTKDLLCLVTKDGVIIRIDHLATVDEFLDALIKGSSYQAAVKLLSLFSLYGGEMHIPMSLLSLLKCYARRGIKLILTNSLVHVTEENKMDKAVYAFTPDSTVKIMDSELCYDQNQMKKAVPIASRFILSCLGYLPSEFRSFAADIMLSGLQSFTKDAPMAILNECRQANQRLMLHDIGLSLNLLEWITDYHTFSSAIPNAFFVSSENSSIESLSCTCCLGSISAPNTLENLLISDSEPIVTVERDEFNTLFNAVNEELNDVCTEKYDGSSLQLILEKDSIENASLFIQNIRREEFGLDPSVSNAESEMLKKQHARLGRALHCLSQELYSQDSHFFLELVQNADDNRYPENVEPTLVFILHSTGIVVLNNEQGFTAQNIKALCDVGNSTKKGSRAGYIGQKGIGFKSVFRVTDAPEIHSNGFHVKFDISDGQIGFVLPTAIAPCNIGSFTRLIPPEVNQSDSCWNTCIMLPFKSELRKGAGMSTIISMFSDLHPSLLLFLHRLRCIKLQNMLNDTSIVMRRETIGNGIIEVTHGKEKMSWFVANEKLQCSAIRPDVQTTEIAVAFTLQESSNGEYRPFLDQQPVFAFLPLRTYGLKFILQGDFVLPSSREEVDGDSAWNQWLLSEFPGLFVNAQRPFCALHCFKENPGKAVAAYMSFVPLVGEVHGFFSHLPRMIISKLRVSNCLLLDGSNNEWVPPCRVLRGWNEHARVVLPDNLLHQHLGLGYLNKDIMLSDSLAKALGVQEYGPRILIDFMSSICGTDEGVRSLGMDWLLSWLNALYMTLAHSSGGAIVNAVMDGDLTKSLGNFPFIPLSDGTYSSLAEGTIWLPCDAFSCGFESEHDPDTFPSLYAKLRTVNPYLLSLAAQNPYCLNETPVDNVVRLLYRIGIQRLSAHELVKLHILPALSDDRIIERDNNLMAEYLSFVMVHLQSSCSICHIEREHIMSELKTKAFILTSHGYKRSVEVDIHFSKDFGNPVDMTKLIDDASYKWHEVDIIYLKHSSSKPSSFGLTKWREFFQELGITDFVKIVQVEKRINDVSHTILKEMMYNGYLIAPGSVVKDWESPELVHLLSALSSQNNIEKNKYLLEVLDKMWDDYFSAKAMGFCIEKSTEDGRKFKSSFLNNIRDVQWIASSIDQGLHYPKNLFYDCEEVRALLGNFAPYAVPQVRSRKFLTDIGFKAEVTLEDTSEILEVWRSSKMPLIASMGQMSKFYAFIWDGVGTAKATIMEEFSSGLSIFVPLANISRHEDPVSGILLSANEVYWHDPTGSVNLARKLLLQCGSVDVESYTLNRMLSHFYHSFHDFFVNGCKVRETPPLESYIQILLQLSHVALPSRAANAVFRVLLKWANDVKSGLLDPKEIIYLKECLLKVENAVLPTVRDKWVSLHSTFGLICWCDNEELKRQFEHSDDINFLYFGKLSTDEKEQLPTKLSGLMQTLGIPSLSEVITRQAIFYGSENCREKSVLVNWVLPYAQRYMYTLHSDKYFQLQQSGFENLSHLRIMVVEKLHYQHTIKGHASSSSTQHECSSLLQDNILYVDRVSDSHSLFLELSRLFFNGNPELHFANFLHMVTTMAESGSTEEQTEFFIMNSQKIPKLPDEEPVWFLSSLLSLQEEDGNPLPICSSATLDDRNYSKPKRKQSAYANWPPANWKTAPDFSFAQENRFRAKLGADSPKEGSHTQDRLESSTLTEHPGVTIGVGVDWVSQVDIVENGTASLLQDRKDQPPLVGSCTPVHGMADNISDLNKSDGAAMNDAQINERDQLVYGTPNAYQATVTGKVGEFVAFKYFIEKVGGASVRWVNQEAETGLPYDLIIGENEENREYIEVKSTKSASKDWFRISTREWQFALEKGDSFSVAHVVLLGPNNAKVTIYKNPLRLCQQGVLQLAVLIAKS